MADKVTYYKTYIWQEQKRYPYYRIQTTDHRVARKLKQRDNSKCTLASYGINSPVWVFRIKYSSPNKARKVLANINHANAEKTAETGIFVSYTRSDIAITRKGKSSGWWDTNKKDIWAEG